MRGGPVFGAIVDMAVRWKQLQASEVALKGEDLDVLRAMSQDDLVQLAYDALETVAKADKYSYAINYLESHLENEGDLVAGWVLSQACPDGSWNKWAKAIGSYSQFEGTRVDWSIYQDWKAAKWALDSLLPEIRSNFKIYPVVLSAGREPRTTEPREA